MACLPPKSERSVLNHGVVLVSPALCSPNVPCFCALIASVKMVRKLSLNILYSYIWLGFSPGKSQKYLVPDETNRRSTVTGYIHQQFTRVYFPTANDGGFNHTHKVRFGNRLSSAFLYFPPGIDIWGVFAGHKMWLYFSTLGFSVLSLGILL